MPSPKQLLAMRDAQFAEAMEELADEHDRQHQYLARVLAEHSFEQEQWAEMYSADQKAQDTARSIESDNASAATFLHVRKEYKSTLERLRLPLDPWNKTAA